MVNRISPRALKRELLLYFTFDHDSNTSITDYSETRFEGKPAGRAIFEPGKRGKAYRFAERNPIEIGYHGIGASSLSLSLWIKNSSAKENQYLFAGFNHRGQQAIPFRLSHESEKVPTLFLNAKKAYVTGKTSINDDRWHHLVYQYTPEKLRLYVDGVLEGETTSVPIEHQMWKWITGEPFDDTSRHPGDPNNRERNEHNLLLRPDRN